MAKSYKIIIENGNAKLFNVGGAYQRTLCGNAVEAEVKGDEVYVKTTDKKRKVYSVKGFYKKTL